jgi:hypothetical protein
MRRLPSFCLLSLFLGFFLFTSCETIRKRESDNPAREAQRLTEEAAVASGKM